MTARIEDFERHRSLLFSIAYRMLGSVADAEDVVQEAYLRWREVPEAEVRSPTSYLAAVVTRLSIDRLRSARVRREEYVGPWLPEPLVTDRGEEGADLVELDESLSMAFLVVLESLNPVERAVFLLREVFDYDYEEIPGIVGKSEANCRQIARRARPAVAARRPRFRALPGARGAIDPAIRRNVHERRHGGVTRAAIGGHHPLVRRWRQGCRCAVPYLRSRGSGEIPAESAAHGPARVLRASYPSQWGAGRRWLRGRIPHQRGSARRRGRLRPRHPYRRQPGEVARDTTLFSERADVVPDGRRSKMG
jgi:RNA polymerase sigma factor (sigma-70 family)